MPSPVLGNKVRVANVGYLNALPFRALGQLDFISYNEFVPSVCSQELREGRADLALIPVAEFLSRGGYSALKFGIVSPRATKSVMLFSQEPLSQIRVIKLDPSSQSSSTLIQILIREFCPDCSERISFERFVGEKVPDSLQKDEGLLLIGDAAIECASRFSFAIDLGEWWFKATNLPFVYAVFAGNVACLSSSQRSSVEKALLQSIASRQELARNWALEHGWDIRLVEDYLTQNIAYILDSEAIKGLTHFAKLGVMHGLFPEPCLDHLTRGIV